MNQTLPVPEGKGVMTEKPTSCSLTVESKASALEGLCKQVLEQLNANQYSQDDIFAVHLAFEEAFLNAVKHGNKMDPTKTVQVDFSVDQEKVEIAITDEGNGFNPEGVPDPRVGANLYRPEGRGLLLIDAYMDEVAYNKIGNRVVMARYRQRPQDQ